MTIHLLVLEVIETLASRLPEFIILSLTVPMIVFVSVL